jgi:hypothetical protein
MIDSRTGQEVVSPADKVVGDTCGRRITTQEIAAAQNAVTALFYLQSHYGDGRFRVKCREMIADLTCRFSVEGVREYLSS